MALPYHRLTEAEADAFDDAVNAAYAEQGEISEDDLRYIVKTLLPGKRVKVRVPDYGLTDWVEVNPEHESRREAAPGGKRAAEPTNEPPSVAAFMRQQAASLGRGGAAERSRQRFEAIAAALEAGDPTLRAYGLGDVQAQAAETAPDAAEVEKAAAELAALPKYGEPGWEQGQQRARELLRTYGRRR